ncbi:MAG: AmmeMemoRadiSam system radical SAM enzyme [Bacteroidales bacterium]|nr:AmmeMemoRadiSam system radical SAM enzyme [Bacteroidales bacterium]MBN2761971.1 AmmeMemoRadiSam system radical SAM enzyme [Bacteroidales bacterium]
MKEALLYQKLDNEKIRCVLCAHRCVVNNGKAGICKVRENINGILYTKVYGRAIAQHIDPIEKKPLYHFYPGSKAYSIATPGCNFRCRFCQNWDISQVSSYEILESGNIITPEQIVKNTLQTNCTSIAYTYTEPTIFFEYSFDIARLANEAELKNIYVSNGYMTSEMLDMINPYLDAINVDLKAFRDETYRQIIGARLQPVLDNLKRIKQMGIWLEVTSLIIPGINDDPGEIRRMANFIVAELGKDVPWHISRFFPGYKMKDIPPTPVKTLQMAKNIGLEEGLYFVYIGNIALPGESDTKCPLCGALLIERQGFGVTRNHIKDGKCPECGLKIAGEGI